jgi:hypothetical protein
MALQGTYLSHSDLSREEHPAQKGSDARNLILVRGLATPEIGIRIASVFLLTWHAQIEDR